MMTGRQNDLQGDNQRASKDFIQEKSGSNGRAVAGSAGASSTVSKARLLGRNG